MIDTCCIIKYYDIEHKLTTFIIIKYIHVSIKAYLGDINLPIFSHTIPISLAFIILVIYLFLYFLSMFGQELLMSYNLSQLFIFAWFNSIQIGSIWFNWNQVWFNLLLFNTSQKNTVRKSYYSTTFTVLAKYFCEYTNDVFRLKLSQKTRTYKWIVKNIKIGKLQVRVMWQWWCVIEKYISGKITSQ